MKNNIFEWAMKKNAIQSIFSEFPEKVDYIDLYEILKKGEPLGDDWSVSEAYSGYGVDMLLKFVDDAIELQEMLIMDIKNKPLSIEDINLGIYREFNENIEVISYDKAITTKCYRCNSDDILFGPPDPDGEFFIYRECSCNKCGLKWDERYDLVKIYKI